MVGRSPAWFFNKTSPGFQPGSGGGIDGESAEASTAFVGGGLGGDVGGDVSTDVRELRWQRKKGGGSSDGNGGGGGDMEACLVRWRGGLMDDVMLAAACASRLDLRVYVLFFSCTSSLFVLYVFRFFRFERCAGGRGSRRGGVEGAGKGGEEAMVWRRA